MTDVNQERLDDYLTSLDAAVDDLSADDYFPHSFDEWNAIRLNTGRTPGDFWTYLTDIDRRGAARYHAALVYFDAIDDDDFVPFTTGE